MQKSQTFFVTFLVPINELGNANNQVTKFIQGPEVSSVLHLDLVYCPQLGQDRVCVGLLCERALPEEQQPRPPRKEAKERQAFEKRPKPQPLR